MLDERDRRAVASAAHLALAGLEVTAVRLGERIDAGSSRSVLWRARAERRTAEPLEVVLKMPTGAVDGFVREQAALSLIGEHRLPGAVRLLGWSSDPPLLVLQDLGDRRSVADRLLDDDPLAAERALVDWAVTVARLQASSLRLGDEFRSRVTTTSRLADLAAASRGATPGAPAAGDLLPDWLAETAEALDTLLRPLGVQAGRLALQELLGLTSALNAGRGAQGLVAGDTCPDNALYVDGQLTLIDFEAAAHRHVAWEAAYLIVPWPTCWCSWAIPHQTRERALDAWRQTLAPSIPTIDTPRFADHLAQAVIGWVFVSMSFLLTRALADTDAGASTGPARGRPRPDLRSLVLHRLQLAAGYPTRTLPALRDLAGTMHDACVERWGRRDLQPAPAFRRHRSP